MSEPTKMRKRDKAKQVLETLTSKREAGVLPKSVTDMLEEIERNGNDSITSMQIIRTPIMAYVKVLMGAISKGTYDDVVTESPYDKMFHLSISLNAKYRLEKNEVIALYDEPGVGHESQFMRVPLPQDRSITIRTLLDKTRDYMGDEAFTNYNARSNNCQDFCLAVLKGNELENDLLESFIHQDAEVIFSEMPEFTTAVATAMTDVAAVSDKLVEDAKESDAYQSFLEKIPEEKIREAVEEIQAATPEVKAIWKSDKSKREKIKETRALMKSLKEKHKNKEESKVEE